VADGTKTPRRTGTLPSVAHPREDDHREVDLVEDLVILPDTTTDDTDAGWGERRADNDERLLDERPPHWE
jgi:hypothetical protein